jgi:ABC-type transport system substrate-binding protein
MHRAHIFARIFSLFSIFAVAIVAHAQTPAQPYAPDPNKVVRYAFEVAETSFDPPRISDLYSNIVNSAMFDTPLIYDYLARPVKLRPNTLASMPEVSADQKTITLRVKPGIYFADDPAFGGKKRTGCRRLCV